MLLVEKFENLFLSQLLPCLLHQKSMRSPRWLWNYCVINTLCILVMIDEATCYCVLTVFNNKLVLLKLLLKEASKIFSIGCFSKMTFAVVINVLCHTRINGKSHSSGCSKMHMDVLSLDAFNNYIVMCIIDVIKLQLLNLNGDWATKLRF